MQWKQCSLFLQNLLDRFRSLTPSWPHTHIVQKHCVKPKAWPKDPRAMRLRTNTASIPDDKVSFCKINFPMMIIYASLLCSGLNYVSAGYLHCAPVDLFSVSRELFCTCRAAKHWHCTGLTRSWYITSLAYDRYQTRVQQKCIRLESVETLSEPALVDCPALRCPFHRLLVLPGLVWCLCATWLLLYFSWPWLALALSNPHPYPSSHPFLRPNSWSNAPRMNRWKVPGMRGYSSPHLHKLRDQMLARSFLPPGESYLQSALSLAGHRIAALWLVEHKSALFIPLSDWLESWVAKERSRESGQNFLDYTKIICVIRAWLVLTLANSSQQSEKQH